MMDFNIFIVVLFLIIPLSLFIYQLFFGHYLKHNTSWVSIGGIGMTLIISLSFLIRTFFNEQDSKIVYGVYEWFSTGSLSIQLGINIDNIAAIMLFVVSLVSFLVHLYSSEYMRNDARFSRYYAFLGLFTFSMNGIVLADNLMMIYIFWELVGLSSFLLIGFWFEKKSASLASNKAFLTNRVGDIGMFIGIMILFFNVGTFSFDGLQSGIAAGAFSDNMLLLTFAGILVFMGAVGKSAQLPLHIWLPDAMEGPTPVSALIHAATMVAAGVYMTLRIFPILTSEALMFIAFIGALTAIFSAIIAITQNDIKKVLAYSTVSQLGYMIMAIGVGAFQAAFFHLVTHAMFKACLFLSSGSVIHGMHHALDKMNDHNSDPQDMRNMGGLKDKMPITHIAMLISTLAISGVPIFSGFISKDAILAGTLSYYFDHGGITLFLPIAGFCAAAITAFYMFRLIFMTFYGKPKNNRIYDNLHESPLSMTLPLIILAVFSFAIFFTGSFNPLHAEGWFTHAVGNGYNVVNTHLVEHSVHGAHEAHSLAMFLSLLVASAGICLAVLFYLLKLVNIDRVTNLFNTIKLYQLSFNKFFIDEIYERLIYRPFLLLSKLASKLDWEIYDQKFIDSFGSNTIKISEGSGRVDYNWLDQKCVDGLSHLTHYFGEQMKKLQGGVIQSYILGGVMGLIIIILILQQI